MIYSVDTCVLLDILLPDPVHGISSKEVLKKASKGGRSVICSIVYAELCPQFDTQVSLDIFLKETGIEVFPFTREILWEGGKAWKDYVSRGGKRKDRIIPDFLIGAFSSLKAEAIITRDSAFYKEHFQLEVYYG
jgi:predicted nucleic acid-binding protein